MPQRTNTVEGGFPRRHASDRPFKRPVNIIHFERIAQLGAKSLHRFKAVRNNFGETDDSVLNFRSHFTAPVEPFQTSQSTVGMLVDEAEHPLPIKPKTLQGGKALGHFAFQLAWFVHLSPKA